MTKRLTAKYKKDRSLRVNRWGRPKSPVNVRDYAPGLFGKKRGKPSNYGTQLNAKQKLKTYYGEMGEKQFRRLYEEAVRRRGDSGENLVELLERRLAAVVYRMKFVPTVFAARQIVNHGHIRVNGRRVNIGSFMVRDGDVIEVSPKAQEMTLVQGAIQSGEREVPDYISMESNGFKGTFLRGPKLADVPYPIQMEPNLVIEFYSR
jgi:small subunit ribosomal protein S4